MLKLPKGLTGHELEGAIGEFLAAASLPLAAPMIALLRVARDRRHLAQGLEGCEAHLDKEAKGLALMREKTGQAAVARLSRLLIVANDGSERFYRNVESLVRKHGDRLMVMKVDADSTQLGAAVGGGDGVVKAVMVDDRETLEAALIAAVKAMGHRDR